MSELAPLKEGEVATAPLPPTPHPAHKPQAPPGEHWALKRDVHRGEGVHVVPAARVAVRARARCEGGQPCYVAAQRFILDQLLVQGRPFYIR